MNFIADRMVELNFGSSIGSQLQKGNFSNNIQKIIEASPDPTVKKYTEKVGVHNVIEMSGFLNLLGAQTIQLTVRKDGTPLTSWIFKTTKNKVEYIQVIHGKLDESTINFDLDLNDFQLGGQRRSGKIHKIGIVGKLLVSSKGIKGQLNMVRLFLAGGVELIKYSGTKNVSSITDRRKRNIVERRSAERKAGAFKRA